MRKASGLRVKQSPPLSPLNPAPNNNDLIPTHNKAGTQGKPINMVSANRVHYR